MTLNPNNPRGQTRLFFTTGQSGMSRAGRAAEDQRQMAEGRRLATVGEADTRVGINTAIQHARAMKNVTMEQS